MAQCREQARVDVVTLRQGVVGRESRESRES